MASVTPSRAVPERPAGLVITPQLAGILLSVLVLLGTGLLAYGNVVARIQITERDNIRLEADVAQLKTQLLGEVQQIGENVAYLCNERRRDNQEAGRQGNGTC